ncbi:MAG: MFS transporter [Pricia sp.]
MKSRPYILPVIILAQFACTSVWFAGNSVVDELTLRTGFGTELIGYILSSVQFGFITGTLTFALLMVADRFSPSRVFLICSFLAALCNLVLLDASLSKTSLLLARFGTGFFLAGIYPVGMKIAADYYEKGLGKALGFLVGALVFGKAFPYLIKSFDFGRDLDMVVKITSTLCTAGGLLLWSLVPDGPFIKPSKRLKLRAGPALFRIDGFRKAAFGYFGHMWELDAFWAFIPFALQSFNALEENEVRVSLWSSVIIALGGLSCILGGYLSERHGSKKVAMVALLLSGLVCLISPLLFQLTPLFFLTAFCLWGMAVTADSPQFSSLVAAAVPPELKGTALTLVNCIGFAISILSIELLSSLSNKISPSYLFLVLAFGPLLGLLGLLRKPT